MTAPGRSPRCTGCGADFGTGRFCGSCGAPAPPAAVDVTMARSALPSLQGEPPRHRLALVLVVVGGVLAVALLAGGVVMLATRGHDDKAAGSSAKETPPASAPSSTTSAPTPAADDGPEGAAAQEIQDLINEEVVGHVDFNRAVGAIAGCQDIDQNRGVIDAFSSQRQSQIVQLRAVDTGGADDLRSLQQELDGVWSTLISYDDDYARWAAGVTGYPEACISDGRPAGTPPELKDRRRALRDDWNSLVAAHPEWGISEVGLLNGDTGFLLL